MTEMNLIEHFGGYDKAKEIAFDPLHPQMTHVSNDGRHWVNEEFSHIPEIQEQIPTMIRIKDIRKALLEYRRQHNIFDVGDWIVVGEHRVLAKFVGYVHKGTHAELPQININGRLYSSYFGAWEHATDEEIKEGETQ